MILRYHGPTIFSMSIKRGLCFRKIKIKKIRIFLNKHLRNNKVRYPGTRTLWKLLKTKTIPTRGIMYFILYIFFFYKN